MIFKVTNLTANLVKYLSRDNRTLAYLKANEVKFMFNIAPKLYELEAAGTVTIEDMSSGIIDETSIDPDMATDAEVTALLANYALKDTAAVEVDAVLAVEVDAVATAVVDAAVQTAAYVQADVQTIADLANDLKAKYNDAVDLINELKADYNATVTLVNELKAIVNTMNA